MNYAEFLKTKERYYSGASIAPSVLPSLLFDWQDAITRWALKKGRAAIFADCGLGKTFMQLAWARSVPGRVLVLAPLCVAEQTVDEGVKLGVPVVYAREPIDARITITNYERMENFDPADYAGVVLDESSILKAFDGKTRQRLIETFDATPYRLCCTATPSPNDIAELANHAEFLGLMTRAEFLATWFVHDDAGWRMKGHAVQPFYRWLSSWALAVNTPSDIGYDDDGFVLPPLRIHDHILQMETASGQLFPELSAKGIGGRLSARRASLHERIAEVVDLVVNSFDDKRRETALLQAVAEEECRVGEGVPCQSDEYGATAPMGERTLSHECRVQGEGSGASEGMAARESGEAQKQSAQDLRTHVAGVQGNTEASALEVRDLWMDGHDSADHLSSRRSLPQDEESPRHPLSELQSWYRQIQERCSSARTRGALPKWILWCGLNEEQDALARIFGSDCLSVQGSDDYEEKTARVLTWIHDPTIPILLSKPKVLGFGMNFQHCHHMAFVGVSDSYEAYYQCLRRCWRFGQKHTVHAHIVVSEAESIVVENVRRKQAAARDLSQALIAHMRDFEREALTV